MAATLCPGEAHPLVHRLERRLGRARAPSRRRRRAAAAARRSSARSASKRSRIGVTSCDDRFADGLLELAVAGVSKRPSIASDRLAGGDAS